MTTTTKTETEINAEDIKTGDEIRDNWDTYTVLNAPQRSGSKVVVALALNGKFYTRVTYFVGQDIWVGR